MTANQLRSRWSERQCRTITDALAAVGTEAFHELSVLKDDLGFWDLRGIVIHRPIEFRLLDHVDLSYCSVVESGMFNECRVNSCKFMSSDFSATNLGGTFLSCDFSRAKFGVMRGAYRSCRFADGTFANALANGVEFETCDFLAANFRRANLYNCSFDSCDWTRAIFGRGSLAGSRFLGSYPHSEALGSTILDDVKMDV